MKKKYVFYRLSGGFNIAGEKDSDDLNNLLEELGFNDVEPYVEEEEKEVPKKTTKTPSVKIPPKKIPPKKNVKKESEPEDNEENDSENEEQKDEDSEDESQKKKSSNKEYAVTYDKDKKLYIDSFDFIHDKDNKSVFAKYDTTTNKIVALKTTDVKMLQEQKIKMILEGNKPLTLKKVNEKVEQIRNSQKDASPKKNDNKNIPPKEDVLTEEELVTADEGEDENNNDKDDKNMEEEPNYHSEEEQLDNSEDEAEKTFDKTRDVSPDDFRKFLEAHIIKNINMKDHQSLIKETKLPEEKIVKISCNYPGLKDKFKEIVTQVNLDNKKKTSETDVEIEKDSHNSVFKFKRQIPGKAIRSGLNSSLRKK